MHAKKIRCLCAALAGSMVFTAGACGQSSTRPTVTESGSTETTVSASQTQTTLAPTTEPEQTATEPEAIETTEAESTTEQGFRVPASKAEMLALYNDTVNRVKKESKRVTQNYNLNTRTDAAEISSPILEKIANSLIDANMGYDKNGDHVVYEAYEDKVKYFTVENQTWASRLTEADVAKATVKQQDGKCIVTLWLVPDTVPNIKIGEGHAGKGFSIVTKDDVVNGAGSMGMSVIEEDSIRMTYKNCKITATIDEDSGNLTGVNYYQEWTLALTALKLDCQISVGIEKDFSVDW